MKGSRQAGFLSIFAMLLAVLSNAGMAMAAPQGKMVIGHYADVTTLDPLKGTDFATSAVAINCYDTLVKRSWNHKTGKIQHTPMLATSWEIVNDTTWVFHLRKGVKFHHGEDFTAEAVKFTIDRMLDPAAMSKYRDVYAPIDRVEIVAPYTVKVITKRPFPTLISNMGFSLMILPPKYFKEKGAAYVANHPSGTGPFKFVRWKKDNECVFEANEDYWGGAPQIKTLVFKPIPEDSTRVAALLGGDIDIAKNIPTHMSPMINKSGTAKVAVLESPKGLSAWFDTLRPGSPLQDKRVRQALNYGVDKESIIKNVLGGNGKALALPISPAIFGHDPGIKPYPYDPQKAKALLKEAGYEKGFTLIYNTPTGRFDKDKEFAEAISGQLAKLGVNIEVRVHEWGNYWQLARSPKGWGDIWTMTFTVNLDADAIYTPLLQCGSPLSKWCNKEFDRLLAQARIQMDPEKRKQLYSQAGRITHDEAVGIFLWTTVETYGISNRVQNFTPVPDEPTGLYMLPTSIKD